MECITVLPIATEEFISHTAVFKTQRNLSRHPGISLRMNWILTNCEISSQRLLLFFGQFNFEKPHTNYWNEEYPDGAPEFKVFRGSAMKYIFNSDEENRFKTISSFKECIIRGGEPVFVWNGLQYGVCFYGDKYCIALANGAQEKICDSPDDVLDYHVGEDRLRDVITQVTVLHRNI